jgi:copper oxidase (laccase) domain-containing protein
MAHGSLLRPGLAWREAGAGAGVPLLVAEDVEAAGIGAAFSCRLGGRSGPPFDSLNIGLNTGDDADVVRANRALLAGALGLEAAALTTVHQVHGPAVLMVEAGRPAPGGEGQPLAAAVTRDGRPSLDLAAGAAELLHAAGIREVRAAGLCTADDPARFFSARRDRRTGRQAGVIVAR